MNRYVVYLIGVLVVVPTGALIAQYMTSRIAGFKPRYVKALISTIVAYVAVNLIGFGFLSVGATNSFLSGYSFLIAWGALSCCHANFLRSETGNGLGARKSVIVAICQILGAAVVLGIILIFVGLIRRAIG